MARSESRDAEVGRADWRRSFLHCARAPTPVGCGTAISDAPRNRTVRKENRYRYYLSFETSRATRLITPGDLLEQFRHSRALRETICPDSGLVVYCSLEF